MSKLPHWLKRSLPEKGQNIFVQQVLKDGSLTTVCEEARCPNRAECFCGGTATFMIMGENCSRTCRFCSVKKGSLLSLDPQEGERLLTAVQDLKLSYVVITTVTRDDLIDGGASHITQIVQLLKRNCSELKIEVLVPDFNGNPNDIQSVVNSGIDVFGHNIEMVPGLHKSLRPEADYNRSLEVLRLVKARESIPVKTGIMVGLGETKEEVCALLDDLAELKIDIVTVGQYLQPGKGQVKVNRYVDPIEFEYYKKYGEMIGIPHVESGPFVRSSYNAADIYNDNKIVG